MKTSIPVKFKFFVSCIVIFLLLLGAGKARALKLDLSSFQHGDIVSNQFFDSLGVTVSADNTYRSNPLLDVAVIFDSRTTPTRDPDLEDPWDRGNIDANEVLGNLIIIPENVRDVKNNETGAYGADGLVDNPDDEGGRPAGKFTFDFDYEITSFGFDLVDIENVESRDGYFATFHSGAQQFELSFTDLANLAEPGSPIVWGDNSANRINPIMASDFGVDSFDKVVIGLGGSGAVTGVNFIPVPEPATLLLFGAGLVSLIVLRKKIKK